MRKFLPTIILIATPFAITACKPGVYMSPGQSNYADVDQNTTIMAETVPTPEPYPNAELHLENQV